MAIAPATRVEPIPGYFLLERLGQGGFGEVWKAEAPGGMLKAIKFVYGSLDDEHSKTATQELKSLNRVKSVRHPFILSLERVDIIDGQLLIVMELADRDLLDRLKECMGKGMRGIPRPELLRYMEETAEALDLMNEEYQLQHLDIKPHNLFLVRNHIKVADFGLAKDLEGMSASLSAGITPMYASPETFEGKVTRFSDQYSLGIVYQEMLTGQRPFNGANARTLLMQHLTAAPDLSPLPEGDRAIVGQTLAKDPQARFPSCMDFVRALQQASEGGSSGSSGPKSLDATPSAELTTPAARADQASPAVSPGRQARATADDIDWEAVQRSISSAVERTSPFRPGTSREVAEKPPVPSNDRSTSSAAERTTPFRPGTSREENEEPIVAKNDNLDSSSSKEFCPGEEPTSNAGTARTRPGNLTTIIQTTETAAQAEPCPQCSAPLTTKNTLRWCMKCGYYSEKTKTIRPSLPKEKKKDWGFFVNIIVAMWCGMPRWQKIMIAGICGVALITIVADLLLPTRSTPRLAWCILQLVAGLGGVIVAQVWAMRLEVENSDGKLTLGDVLRMPKEVWSGAYQRLPETRWPVWLTAWGFGLALGAVLVGEPGSFRRPASSGTQAHAEEELRRAIEAGRQKQNANNVTKSLQAYQEQGNKFAGEPVIPGKPLDPSRDLGQVVIAGYIPDSADPKKVGTVVMGTYRDGTLVYGGTTSSGFTPAEADELRNRLSSLKRTNSPGWDTQAPSGVVWVELDPKLQSVVDHAGANGDGTLKDSKFRRFVK